MDKESFELNFKKIKDIDNLVEIFIERNKKEHISFFADEYIIFYHEYYKDYITAFFYKKSQIGECFLRYITSMQ